MWRPQKIFFFFWGGGTDEKQHHVGNLLKHLGMSLLILQLQYHQQDKHVDFICAWQPEGCSVDGMTLCCMSCWLFQYYKSSLYMCLSHPWWIETVCFVSCSRVIKRCLLVCPSHPPWIDTTPSCMFCWLFQGDEEAFLGMPILSSMDRHYPQLCVLLVVLGWWRGLSGHAQLTLHGSTQPPAVCCWLFQGDEEASLGIPISPSFPPPTPHHPTHEIREIPSCMFCWLLQGDEEAFLGMPISPYMDRYNLQLYVL